MACSIVRQAGIGALLIAAVSCGCRDSEPPRPHNRDLGDAERSLLPPPTMGVAEAPVGNRRVEIPDRTMPVQVRAVDDDTARDPDEGERGGGVISGFLGRLRGVAGHGQGADADRAPTEE